VNQSTSNIEYLLFPYKDLIFGLSFFASRIVNNMSDTDRTKDVLYSSQEYWESRYKDKAGFHEWYCSFETLQPLLESHISKDSSILEIGCGDSPLLTGFQTAGHTGKMEGIDFSEGIVQKLIDDENKSQSSGSMTYREMDARRLSYEEGSWDNVIDKGTVDAMLCDKRNGIKNARGVVSEAVRVLKKSSGTIIFVSHIQTESAEFDEWIQNCILPVLDTYRSSLWKIEAHTGSTSCSEVESPTVYIITSKPRRFTRGCLSSSAVEMSVMSHSDSDKDEED
jgi:SAM-dependent methyltransferase